MKVFKFGGASVRHAEAIRKVAGIVRTFRQEKILIVVSAIGKTTNALERVVEKFRQEKDYHTELGDIRRHHETVIAGLFAKPDDVRKKIILEFASLEKNLDRKLEADQLYDQIVSIGEILSSIIVAEFLREDGLPIRWVDSRNYIATDATYREGKVDWQASEEKMVLLKKIMDSELIVTQGFIGRNAAGFTTTLGREGSDYSAAIYASCLGAESVTIWKDVPGVMNADPKRFSDASVFEELPFREAAEMTYYGASVIHPKTIKPLANKNIPLLVKNFDDPSLPGTVIHETKMDHIPPLIVVKDNQCLVSCRVTDYTFIDEQQLGYIFQALADLNIKINVMQNSAISFSFCIDYREDKVMKLIERLAGNFEVYYNTGLTLVTIKNYNAALSDEYRKKPGVLLEQSSRSTLQILLKT
jgi:aspartate kinase